MIVIFGASSGVGRAAAASLLDGGARVRLVAKDPGALDRRAEHAVGGIAEVRDLTRDAATVISCAHASYTAALLAGIPANARVVLVGSAWRYSKTSDPRAEQVRSAEAVFLASRRDGVMLHPTMIYGGAQESNLLRLFALIRRSPVIPMPGGGARVVQPIFVDDVAACVVAGATREWSGGNVVSIAGPRPMTWREMTEACLRAAKSRRLLLPVPLGPILAMLRLFEALKIPVPVQSSMIERFNEDTVVSLAAMRDLLGVMPRELDAGLHLMLNAR